jgi:hypothetical protein
VLNGPLVHILLSGVIVPIVIPNGTKKQLYLVYQVLCSRSQKVSIKEHKKKYSRGLSLGEQHLSCFYSSSVPCYGPPYLNQMELSSCTILSNNRQVFCGSPKASNYSFTIYKTWRKKKKQIRERTAELSPPFGTFVLCYRPKLTKAMASIIFRR